MGTYHAAGITKPEEHTTESTTINETRKIYREQLKNRRTTTIRGRRSRRRFRRFFRLVRNPREAEREPKVSIAFFLLQIESLVDLLFLICLLNIFTLSLLPLFFHC